MALDETLGARRYEPPLIDLSARNNSHTLLVEFTGTGKTVLEVGTATGYLSRILKEHGNRVCGIEVDVEAAGIAAQHCERMVTGDIETLDLAREFSPESFDVIIFGDVLEHLKWPQAVLKKVRPLLKPDGYLVVSIPNVSHGDVVLRLLQGRFPYADKGLLDATHVRFFGPADVLRLFAEAGYQVGEFESTHTDIGSTELQVDLSAFPPQLIESLRVLPHAEIYQFLFKAFKSAAADAPVVEVQQPDVLGAFNSVLAPPLEAARAAQRLAEARSAELEQTLETILTSHGWRGLQHYYRWRHTFGTLLRGLFHIKPAATGMPQTGPTRQP